MPGRLRRDQLAAWADMALAGVRGDVVFRGASAWERLGAGTAGYVLTTQGAGANPTWTAPGGGGDHATQSNLTWTASGHTGTASRVAAFSGAGAASYLAIGTDLQAWDAGLDALAALATTGLVARTGAATYVPRTITSAAAGRISITDGDGVAGNPTIDTGADVALVTTALSGDLGGTLAAPTVVDLTIASEAHGDLLYRGAGSWVRLAPGTAGHVLASGGAGAAPTWAAPGGGSSATTVEANLGSSATFQGKFTITDATITGTSKVLCWQAPGPYTGKGTLPDEAEMVAVQVVSVTPAAGSAVVRWETARREIVRPVIAQGRRDVAAFARPAVPGFECLRGNYVRGNVKFSYIVLS